MGRPRKWESDAERKRAERGSEKPAENVSRNSPTEPTPSPSPKRQSGPKPASRDSLTVPQLVAAARVGQITLTDQEEQIVRDFFGYAASESRSLAERDRVANRIAEQARAATEGLKTARRYDPQGRAVEEALGPRNLSLTAFPVQLEGDLTPSPEARKKLDGAVA